MEQLPSGSYRAVVFAGSNALTGRPRYVRETVRTRDEAKMAVVKLQRQVDEDQQPKSKITVKQAVEQWLDVAELEDTIRERYQDLVRLYVLPTFGHLGAAKLDAVAPRRVQQPRGLRAGPSAPCAAGRGRRTPRGGERRSPASPG